MRPSRKGGDRRSQAIEAQAEHILALVAAKPDGAVEGLWSAIGRYIGLFTPRECANSFNAAGYESI